MDNAITDDIPKPDQGILKSMFNRKTIGSPELTAEELRRKEQGPDEHIRETPVTQEELVYRLTRREEPVVIYNLHPDGATEQEVKTESQKENEKRIKFLEKRLEEADKQLKSNFNRASNWSR